MGQPWENPDYAGQRRRQRRRVLVPLLLALIVAAAFWSLRNNAPGEAPAAAGTSPHSPAVADPTRDDRLSAPAEDPLAAPPGMPPLEDEADLSDSEAPQATASGGNDDFSAHKSLALSLYRQNKLTEALEQAQAALALRLDDELLELQARLKREIRVQRNYDDARTANFVVLFDGYEHEEMKPAVLGILKDAYAEMGKELNHFPGEPITVILYTAKDFTDVTRAPEWSGGMFGQIDGKIRVPVQGVAGQERVLRRVLYHEYVHALLYSMAPDCPLWLHEGLAQYLGGDEAVSVGQVIPLALLVKGFPRDARTAYVAYMESLQAVSDLVDEHGMPPLRRLLNELGSGKGLEAAFAAAYGRPFSRWAAEWRQVQRE